MLTSAAREVLQSVETVIVDEVHALAGDKRGAHLSLSLERLDDLLEAPAQRIGLSATVRPRDAVARFLGGAHPVTVVAQEAPPALDLAVRVPVQDMTAVPAFGGFCGAGDGTRERGGGPRRAAVENAWKSDRAMRAVMAAESGAAPKAAPLQPRLQRKSPDGSAINNTQLSKERAFRESTPACTLLFHPETQTPLICYKTTSLSFSVPYPLNLLHQLPDTLQK